VEIAEPWVAALEGIEASQHLQVFYWLHQARRDLVQQSPQRDGQTHGTFALRSPLRPNPIGSSLVRLVRRDGPVLEVRGLDCVDGTPLLDLKPEVCPLAGG
jgi:tRNA-Thr(GGU) m(6)t(6)A37 methyltransferase TsaA